MLIQDQIRSLNSQNSELKSQIEVLSTRTRDNSSAGLTPDRDDLNSGEAADDNEQCQTFSSSSSDSLSVEAEVVGQQLENGGREEPRRPVSAQSSSSVTSTASNSSSLVAIHNNNNRQQEASVPPLSKDVAVLKLEQKFRQAMGRVAELTAEKEQLEHLIVRLQEETDTVGEYITIYQYQRSQQRLRLDEKEKQLQAVSRDREELKAKLAELQSLVTSFIAQKGSHTTENVQGSPIQLAEDALAVHKQESAQDVKVESSPTAPNNAESKSENATAGKILSLISEIGSNEALNSTPTKEDFHPWFWDHSPGKLMTV